jgi:hypothetical protein
MTTSRLPDFVIIGAGKSGTTTLYRWLAAQPEVFSSSLKEPRFFSRDWHKGIEWYSALFAGGGQDQLVGEASTNYTDIEYCEVAAQRMVDIIPGVRLVYLLRHPIDRLHSQYRHNWRRAVESEPLADAVLRPNNPYVGRSLYHSRLQPYAERFARQQICVVRFEDLVVPPQSGWGEVLDHLGLEERPAPGDAHNVTADQASVSTGLRRLERGGWLDRLPPVPNTIRQRATSVLQRVGRRPPAPTDVELPPAVVGDVWADIERLEDWLGGGRLWDRTD